MTRFRRPDVAWILAVALLVALPFVVDVWRSHEFEASVDLLLRDERGIRDAEDREAHVRAVLAEPHVENNLVARSGVLVAPGSIAPTAEITATRPKVTVTVTANSPVRARDLGNALAELVSEVTVGDMTTVRRAVAPQPTRLVDRVLDRLPGPLPPTPHPVLAAGAGFIIALLLYYIFLAYDRRISE